MKEAEYVYPGIICSEPLTKRELFAAMAMQGILGGLPETATYSAEVTAKTAVKHADALLAELAKPQERAQ